MPTRAHDDKTGPGEIRSAFACEQRQVQTGIDAVIVDNVLAIRKGLTDDEAKKLQKKAEKAILTAANGVEVKNGVHNEVTNGKGE